MGTLWDDRPAGPDVKNVPPSRDIQSHVHANGTPKKVMTAEEATDTARRHGQVAYLCGQKPEHYHVGKFDGKG